MNEDHRKIRARLRAMAPVRAISYIDEIGLPEEERLCLIECDIKQRSYIQVSRLLNISPESIKKGDVLRFQR